MWGTMNYKKSILTFINRIIEKGSLYLGVLLLFVAVVSSVFTSLSYRNQVLQHSWNTISSHAPGNSGVSTALEYLHSRGERLTDINLIPIVYAEEAEARGVHRTSLVNSNLPDVDLSGSWLDHTDFSGSTLTNAILNNIRMHDAVLDRADLTAAYLNGATLTNTSMSETIANLLKASYFTLNQSTLNRAQFNGAILENSTIKETNALDSNFSDANLNGADLSDSSFVNVSFYNASFINALLLETRFFGVDLSDANFSKARLLETKFFNVNFSDADFTGAEGLDKVDWSRSWAWADRKPKGLEQQVSLEYFSPRCRDSNYSSSNERPESSCKVAKSN